jgi:hypothetical protein
MSRYFQLLIILILFLFSANISFAEDQAGETGYGNESRISGFWLSLGGDISMYSYLGLSYGGSFALGYGTGSSVGFKASFFYNEEGIDTLELNVFLRFYLFGANAYKGPFLQLMGGPSLYNRRGNFSLPSPSGMFSAGLCFGWRFMFSDIVFIEPHIRGGYPYLISAGVSAGLRF